MDSRKPQSRFARARGVLIGLLAIGLVGVYGVHHRTELGQIVDELRTALSVGSRAAVTQPGRGLEQGWTDDVGDDARVDLQLLRAHAWGGVERA